MPNYKKLPAQSKYFNGPLYQRMLDDLHLAGMADRTIYGYIRAVRQLAEFSQLAPDQLTEEHVRRWLLHLKVEQQRAYGTLRVAFSGIKFFFTRTCRRVWNVLAETKLQNIKSLPDVLTINEVHQIINARATMMLLRASKTRNFQSLSTALTKNVCTATANSTTNNQITNRLTKRTSVRKHRKRRFVLEIARHLPSSGGCLNETATSIEPKP